MRLQSHETEEQRRRRIASRIRNEMLDHLARHLVDCARDQNLPDIWMSVERVNDVLTDAGYWSSHPHVMTPFLSQGARDDIVSHALDRVVATHPDLWACVGEQYKPAGRDWNAYAIQMANRIRREFPDAERTVYHTGADGASFLFAHSKNVNDSRAREEVSFLRKYLHDNAIPELGFGVSADGRTWVMVVWSQDEQSLKCALFEAWQRGFGTSDEIRF